MTFPIIKPDWPAPAHIHALTTTRVGGISQPPYDSLNLAIHVGDDTQAVIQNRQTLQTSLQLPQQPYWLNQTHSIIAVPAKAISDTPTADASFTQQTNIVCCVLTADCLPVLVCDKAGTTVAAIHAGWRGLADGVIEATINQLPVQPSELLVWLGPAIGPLAFEVKQDVIAAFTQHDSAALQAFTLLSADTWLGNMYLLARQRLHALGITAIYGGTHCTYTETNLFYSFRRDGHTGRMASIIWIGETA